MLVFPVRGIGSYFSVALRVHISAAILNLTRFQRKLALDRVVELIRIYAIAHKHLCGTATATFSPTMLWCERTSRPQIESDDAIIGRIEKHSPDLHPDALCPQGCHGQEQTHQRTSLRWHILYGQRFDVGICLTAHVDDLVAADVIATFFQMLSQTGH